MGSEHSYLLVYIILTAIFFTCSCNEITTPLFIIDNEKVILPLERLSNTVEYISKAAFLNIIEDMMKLSEFHVVFVEERLSVADIESGDALGTPYYYLQQHLLENRTQYLPAVVDPFDALSELLPVHHDNVLYLHKNITYKIPPCNYESLFVFFQDESTQTRVEMLRDHDRIMKDIYLKVRQEVGGPVLVFYTGKSNLEWMKTTNNLPDYTSQPNIMMESFTNSVSPLNFRSNDVTDAEESALFHNKIVVMTGCGPMKFYDMYYRYYRHYDYVGSIKVKNVRHKLTASISNHDMNRYEAKECYVTFDVKRYEMHFAFEAFKTNESEPYYVLSRAAFYVRGVLWGQFMHYNASDHWARITSPIVDVGRSYKCFTPMYFIEGHNAYMSINAYQYEVKLDLIKFEDKTDTGWINTPDFEGDIKFSEAYECSSAMKKLHEIKTRKAEEEEKSILSDYKKLVKDYNAHLKKIQEFETYKNNSEKEDRDEDKKREDDKQKQLKEDEEWENKTKQMDKETQRLEDTLKERNDKIRNLDDEIKNLDDEKSKEDEKLKNDIQHLVTQKENIQNKRKEVEEEIANDDLKRKQNKLDHENKLKELMNELAVVENETETFRQETIADKNKMKDTERQIDNEKEKLRKRMIELENELQKKNDERTQFEKQKVLNLQKEAEDTLLEQKKEKEEEDRIKEEEEKEAENEKLEQEKEKEEEENYQKQQALKKEFHEKKKVLHKEKIKNEQIAINVLIERIAKEKNDILGVELELEEKREEYKNIKVYGKKQKMEPQKESIDTMAIVGPILGILIAVCLIGYLWFAYWNRKKRELKKLREPRKPKALPCIS